jgi:hypothetical protein
MNVDIKGIPPSTMRKLMERRLVFWSQYSGIQIDKKKFSFKGHNYLYPIYDCRAENMVIMKSAQMGLTIYMLLKAFHMSLFPYSWGFDFPIKIGFYFPEAKGVGRIVKDRVTPMMKSSPDLMAYSREMRQDLKPVGDSTVYFLYMGGTSTKDSVPLNAVFFDEVRLVNIQDIEQAYHRVLASEPFKYKTHISTAGLPRGDIHKLFLDSDQRWFHTICPNCKRPQILAKNFPDCIALHPEHSTRAGQAYYICENGKCRAEIKNSGVGLYIANNPRSEIAGFHISQLISHKNTPKDILRSFDRTKNKKEFWNSVLGLPYVDVNNKPLSEEMLDDNVRPLLKWGESMGDNYMGVDQMMGLNYVFVLTRKGEEKRVVWFEVIENEDPWKRTAEIYERFQPKCCIIDALPNANEAQAFANYYGKNVFLAYFGNYRDQIRWEDDSQIKRPNKNSNPRLYHQHKVFLDKYTSVDQLLAEVAEQKIVWPNPDEHLITCRPFNGGVLSNYPVMKTHAYPHIACPVRETIEVEENTGFRRPKNDWRFVGMDPHALDALIYANYASERRASTFAFHF